VKPMKRQIVEITVLVLFKIQNTARRYAAPVTFGDLVSFLFSIKL
jgi:hypothetical protein